MTGHPIELPGRAQGTKQEGLIALPSLLGVEILIHGLCVMCQQRDSKREQCNALLPTDGDKLVPSNTGHTC